MHFDTPKTKAMREFLKREASRVVGLSIEPDGVFIYTNSREWCDDAGAGTWRADSETAAIRAFYETVRKAENAAPTVSARAALLFQNIVAMLRENDGHPVFVKNPLVLELIDAGALVETAPRDTWTDGGIAYVQCVVNLPEVR